MTERMSFKRACEIIYAHYGKENVLQIRKPPNKNFYVVDFKNFSGTHLTSKELKVMEANL